MFNKFSKLLFFINLTVCLMSLICTPVLANSDAKGEPQGSCQEHVDSASQNETNMTVVEPDDSPNLEESALPSTTGDMEVANNVRMAAQSFKNYFDTVGNRLLEREELIKLISIALIAKEHVLVMGPPGNAKSLLSDEVLGNITDASGKNSYYRIQMTPETTMSETHGPINPKEILESGRIDRQYDQGILDKRNAFIDEIFDGRANALRNILGVLAERQHAQGGHIEKGNTETVIAATNKYIDEVYEKAGDDSPRAVLDRFAFNAYVSGEFEFNDSYKSLIKSAGLKKEELPQLTFDELDVLRDLVKDVAIPDSVAEMLTLISFRMKAEAESMEAASVKEYKKKLRNGEEPVPPYRSTKYHSPRTLYKAASMLKAMVVYDYAMSGGKRPLVANFNDLEGLKVFFTLNGPSNVFVEDLLDRTSNPYERSQLSAILTEREMYNDIYSEIYDEVNSVIYRHTLADLIKIDFSEFSSKSEIAKKEVYDQIITGLAEVKLQLSMSEFGRRQSQVGAEDIGLSAVYDVLDQMLINNFSPEQYESAYTEIEAATVKIISEFEEAEKKRVEALDNLKDEQSTLTKILESLESKRGELFASQTEKLKVSDLYFDINFDGGFERIRLIRDMSKKSIALLNQNNMQLLQPEGSDYFSGVGLDSDASNLILGNNGSVNHALVNDDGNLVIFSGAYESTINLREGLISEQKRTSKTTSLVAEDSDGKKLIIADFSKSKLTIRDRESASENIINLNGFKVFQGDTKRDSDSNEFDEFLRNDLSQSKSFVSGSKLIAMYPETHSAFIVDINSGDSQYISSFKDEFEELVSVDENGNFYGISFQENYRVLKVFKFSSHSETPSVAISEQTIQINDSKFNSENIFSSATVDSTGMFIVTAERHRNNNHKGASGFYIYSLETGEVISESSFLSKNDHWPEKVVNHGQNQFLFLVSKDGDSQAPYYLYGANFGSKDIENTEIGRLTEQIQVTKDRLTKIQTELRSLE